MNRPSAAALLVALAASGCASSTPADGAQPEGLAEQRAVLAERRAETRSVMEDSTSQSSGSVLDGAANAGGTMLGWLGSAGNTALDVLTLQALGLW